jgi:acyl phosphate:glycerol-3-phosphate acyltransferase
VTPEQLNQWWWLAIAAYLLGSIPCGYLVARHIGQHDIRSTGSGSTGATNVARLLGPAAGAMTLLLDAAKGFFAAWLASRLTGHSILWMSVAAFASVVGHVYPLWLGGRGSRDVATAAGAFLLICWPAVLTAIAIWLVLLAGWRYVSLASIAAAAALPLLIYLFYARGYAPPLSLSISAALCAVLILWRHRENLGRLAAGSEPRFHFGRSGSLGGNGRP